MNANKNYYLTGPELALCCAAVGVRMLPCFSGLHTTPSAEETAEAACAMTGRGLLTGGTGSALLLCPDLTEIFRTVNESPRVVFVGQDDPNLPHCLLYGGPERLALLWPGRDGRLGAASCEAADAGRWLADAHLLLEDSLAPDLLETVSDAEREADLARCPEAVAFLRRYAFPGTQPLAEGVPPELLRCAESRRASDLKPLARLLIARLPLYDHLIWGNEHGAADELYTQDRAAARVLALLSPCA